MNGALLKNKIEEWLIKGGFPLELFAYNELKKQGFFSVKSPLYKDIESDVTREIDISAEKTLAESDNSLFTLKILVECKKSTKPFLVLCDSENQTSVREEIYGARVYPNRLSNSLAIANMGHKSGVLKENDKLPLSDQVLSGYSIIQAFSNTDEKLYKTIYGLSKAEYYFEYEHEKYFRSSTSSEDKYYPIELLIPILLVDAPIFNVYLKNDKLHLEEASWASVTLNLPWYLEKDTERRSNVQVVNKNHFGEVLIKLESFAKWLADSNDFSDGITNK